MLQLRKLLENGNSFYLICWYRRKRIWPFFSEQFFLVEHRFVHSYDAFININSQQYTWSKENFSFLGLQNAIASQLYLYPWGPLLEPPMSPVHPTATTVVFGWAGLLQMIIWMGCMVVLVVVVLAFCRWSSIWASLLQMIIWVSWPLANDHPDPPAFCN